jgi:hypothetical protein
MGQCRYEGMEKTKCHGVNGFHMWMCEFIILPNIYSPYKRPL